ncbi:MAG: ankyrin repeat domain-containing protein [Pyrinomonadaceae bacterium]
MLGFTLKRNPFPALLLLISIIGLSRTTTAQQSDTTRPNSSETNILLDDLVAAIDRDDKLEVMRVLSNGFPANVTDSKGSTMLMQAAKGGKVNVATLLLDSGADPNLVASNGATALMLAVSGGHSSTVRALLSNGADPNIHGSGMPAALTYATAVDNAEILSALVNAGADLSTKDQRGYDALEFAFLNKKSAALKFLRPLYMDRESLAGVKSDKFSQAILEKNDAVLIRWLALGSDPVALIDKQMPLELAIAGGYGTGVALLVHAGANVNQTTRNGVPVWWTAIPKNKSDAVNPTVFKTLMKSGADLNLKAKGKTAVEFAGSNKEAVAILKANGAR